MQAARYFKKMALKKTLFFGAIFFFFCQKCFSYTVHESKDLSFVLDTYFRADSITLKNTATLDSHNEEDHCSYLGIDYSLGFRLDYKNDGPKFYLKIERNGPYDYDAPVWIHNTLLASADNPIREYRREELLPQAEEFWFDLPLIKIPVRFKAGLFPYDVGKGYAQGLGSYENYGVNIYYPGEDFSWRFNYFRPDMVNKTRLGPRIKQDIEQGISYEHNCANYFAFDSTFKFGRNKLQPFVGVLLDNTSEGKRYNLFATPTHKETLGTLGLDYDTKIKDLVLGFELARNFGSAKSEDPAFKDVEHKGYIFYSNVSYELGKFVPQCQFLYSSGNKVTTEMVDNGDTRFNSGSNKAFSSYSPLNDNFFDCLTPSQDSLPLVFFGWGNGISYGVGLNRPSTLADDALIENVIMPSAGFVYNFSDDFSLTFSWWFILANERGVGTLGGAAKELSRNLGQEVDLSFSYALNKNINITLDTGCFFPGKYFLEERDDTSGSLFTPYVRGDGNANNAY
ncbi:MAG: alginate export family protein, partial [Candidatus Omnitrophica bacterium]|nr:alginate export family protein [Candidatus Omnitrophota bacterium]